MCQRFDVMGNLKKFCKILGWICQTAAACRDSAVVSVFLTHLYNPKVRKLNSLLHHLVQACQLIRASVEHENRDPIRHQHMRCGVV